MTKQASADTIHTSSVQNMGAITRPLEATDRFVSGRGNGMMRVGIVGIGAIAENYISLIAAGKINARLTAVSTRNFEHARAVLTNYNMAEARIYENCEDMLDSGEIDAMIICTPHYLHPKMAMQAIERGIPVLIEKPLGVYGDEVAALVACAEKNPSVCCGVLYCKRMNQAFRLVKELLEKDAIGELKRVDWMITDLYRTAAYHRSSAWRGTFRGEGGGVLMNQASHQLDMLLWLCPPPLTVRAFCREGVEREIEVENDATLLIQFEGGAVGRFTASSMEFPGTNRLELSGSGGQIIVENDCRVTYTRLETDERTFSQTSTALFGVIPSTRETFDFEPAENAVYQAALINDFLDAAQSGGQPVCPLCEAARSLYLINGAYLSSWTNAGVVLPPDHAAFRRALERRF